MLYDERVFRVYLNTDAPCLKNARVWEVADKVKKALKDAFPCATVIVYVESVGSDFAPFHVTYEALEDARRIVDDVVQSETRPEPEPAPEPASIHRETKQAMDTSEPIIYVALNGDSTALRDNPYWLFADSASKLYKILPMNAIVRVYLTYWGPGSAYRLKVKLPPCSHFDIVEAMRIIEESLP
jgi:hypothetical protein